MSGHARDAEAKWMRCVLLGWVVQVAKRTARHLHGAAFDHIVEVTGVEVAHSLTEPSGERSSGTVLG